jgi:hypothetical protein
VNIADPTPTALAPASLRKSRRCIVNPHFFIRVEHWLNLTRLLRARVGTLITL